MRRSVAVIVGLVLVGGLVACGEDSGGNPDDDFCMAYTELQTDVVEFNAMVTSGSTIDELEVQASAVAASAKNLTADAQRLDDQAAKDKMNQATLDLEAAVTTATESTLSPEQQVLALTDAVDRYEASAGEVASQVGCPTG